MRPIQNRTFVGVVASAAAVAVVAVSARAPAATQGAKAGATLHIAMSDGALTADRSSLPAGRTLVSVATTGRRAHALILARLDDGVTPARFKRALNTKDGQAAVSLASFRGGIDSLPPAGTPWQMVTDLRPGTYVVVDHAENGGQPNFDRGGFATVRVTAAQGPQAVAPAARGSIEMVDFAFRIHLSNSFHGRGWIRFANRGHDIHRIILLRLNPGVSFGKADAAIHAHNESNQHERPPGLPIELIGAVSPGFDGYLKLNLPPGRYVAACFEADASTQFVPHTDLGMIGHFTIS
jgi:hypothetical protein